ncbi:MocR-like pyridoxine biosynthesis transcription factor PdxR [Curvivirga aplysinae]|uniref:MocR-like pyridoxine biosynthesis transcription factor PdxR n=1 Tax=Curvivirga aplysinae TaxID=2529852 RepID=UPI0012BCFBE1|nr:PLP-dependent aminotransferase family protein [Curvivirga aplysinae]MTI08577.1 PLP-dependent aminotransferase family protein [Curvivirga aplysinae]
MREAIFHLERTEGGSIQTQLRHMLVDAILSGQLEAGKAVPSCRKLAQQLKVSRNTVVMAYQGLVDDGFLVARERSGYYVDPDITVDRLSGLDEENEAEEKVSYDWESRLNFKPGRRKHKKHFKDWREQPYPFVAGQMDYTLFPLASWRECSRQAMGRKIMEDVSFDAYDEDDPELLDQIRTRLLPRRGINAKSSQILVTMGVQNALYLIGALMISEKDTVGLEEPGYQDSYMLCTKSGAKIKSLPLDENGVIVDEKLNGCDYVYVTPSHNSPTTVTLSMARRKALLEKASEEDFLILEDDYEPETNFIGNPTPALKSLDKEGRVIYMGSLSKSVFPALRMGYIVAPEPLIRELRALRRLMYRHPPSNNQRTAALFLGQGHYDSFIARLKRIYKERWEIMREALDRYLPGASVAPTFGGTCFWVKAPESLDSSDLAESLREDGVLIEPCEDFFFSEGAPSNYFRLGYTSVPNEKIDAGIELIAKHIKKLSERQG